MLEYYNSFLGSVNLRRKSELLISFKKYINYLLLVIIFLIASIPLLKAGFSGDDIVLNLYKSEILTKHSTFFASLKGDIMGEIYTTGRLHPMVFILMHGFDYLFGINLMLFNFCHWIIVLISYYITALFLKKLNFSNNNILLFFCLLPFSWSLFPGTTLVSFGVLLPGLLIFMMSLFINYINFLKTKQTQYVIYSIIFALLGFLTYEIFFLIIPIIFLLNKYYEDKFFIINKATFMVLAVALLYLAITITFRHLFIVHYSGTQFGNLINFPMSFLRHLVSELPLSYFVYSKNMNHAFNWEVCSLALLLTICSLIASYRLLNKTATQIFQSQYIFFISVLLQIIPPLMIGMSKKYQAPDSYGTFYVQAYIQQIGLTIMLIVFFQWLLTLPKLSIPKHQFFTKTILSLLISIVTGLTFLTNNHFSNMRNQYSQYPREIYQQALSQGLFNKLSLENAIFLRPGFYDSESYWNSKFLLNSLISNGNHNIFLYNLRDHTLLPSQKVIETKLSNNVLNNTFYLDYKNISHDTKGGYVFLGHIANIQGILPNAEFKLEDIKIFYTARSQKNLKEILSQIAKNYNLENNQQFSEDTNRLLSKRTELSGFISLSGPFGFYWNHDRLQPDFS